MDLSTLRLVAGDLRVIRGRLLSVKAGGKEALVLELPKGATRSATGFDARLPTDPGAYEFSAAMIYAARFAGKTSRLYAMCRFEGEGSRRHLAMKEEIRRAPAERRLVLSAGGNMPGLRGFPLIQRSSPRSRALFSRWSKRTPTSSCRLSVNVGGAMSAYIVASGINSGDRAATLYLSGRELLELWVRATGEKELVAVGFDPQQRTVDGRPINPDQRYKVVIPDSLAGDPGFAVVLEGKE